MTKKTLTCAPRSAEEAAEIFRACGAAAAAGRRVRVGVVESPFWPPEGLAPEARSPHDFALGGSGEAREIGTPGASNLAREIGAPGGSSVAREIESLGASDEALVLMSHAAMNEIQEISKRDYLAVVGGGVKFADLLAAAWGAGLYFPHEPDSLAREETVARIIMDGTIFNTEGRFGSLREYILALELVTPGGETIRTGSRSVKDVTGYDVAGFMMGSGARCGMIARATIRLLPACRTRFPFACAGSAKLVDKFADVLHANQMAAFLEIFEDRAARVLGERIGAAHAEAVSTILLVGELQGAGAGKERELFERAKEIALAELSIQRLDAGALDAYRRFPSLALDASGESRILCVAYDSRPMAAKCFSAYNAMSLYPARRRNYFPLEALPEGLMAIISEAGERVRVEMIERIDGRVARRRVGRGELKRILGSRAAGWPSEDEARKSDPEALLAERLYRVFDPRGIMLQ